MADSPNCFACKTPILTDVGCSAYHPSHQPPVTGPIVKGNSCLCTACGEVFTTVRTFDSHQKMEAGKVVCADPRRMRDRKHRRKLVLTPRGWAKNPELSGFNTFDRKAASV